MADQPGHGAGRLQATAPAFVPAVAAHRVGRGAASRATTVEAGREQRKGSRGESVGTPPPEVTLKAKKLKKTVLRTIASALAVYVTTHLKPRHHHHPHLASCLVFSCCDPIH